MISLYNIYNEYGYSTDFRRLSEKLTKIFLQHIEEYNIKHTNIAFVK